MSLVTLDGSQLCEVKPMGDKDDRPLAHPCSYEPVQQLTHCPMQRHRLCLSTSSIVILSFVVGLNNTEFAIGCVASRHLQGFRSTKL